MFDGCANAASSCSIRDPNRACRANHLGLGTEDSTDVPLHFPTVSDASKHHTFCTTSTISQWHTRAKHTHQTCLWLSITTPRCGGAGIINAMQSHRKRPSNQTLPSHSAPVAATNTVPSQKSSPPTEPLLSRLHVVASAPDRAKISDSSS